MNDVDYSSFSNSDWETPGTQVWQGTLMRAGDGWLDLPLQTQFYHQAGKNLLISFRHQDGSWEASYNAYRRSYVSPYRCKTGAHNDDNPPDMSRMAHRSNILITYYPGTGVEESPGSVVRGRPCPTFVSHVLRLPAGYDGSVLLDATGRRAMELHAGVNEVHSLRAGVYFLRRQRSAEAFRVVVQR
jgi:hypothetical protein